MQTQQGSERVILGGTVSRPVYWPDWHRTRGLSLFTTLVVKGKGLPGKSRKMCLPKFYIFN